MMLREIMIENVAVIEKAAVQFGASAADVPAVQAMLNTFSLQASFAAEEQNDESRIAEIERGGLDLFWAATNQDLERRLLPVRIPLYKGLLGHRLLVIRQQDAARFAPIRTLEELARLKASGKPLMVFDCSFDLMNPPAGHEQYLQVHIDGALFADLLGLPILAPAERRHFFRALQDLASGHLELVPAKGRT